MTTDTGHEHPSGVITTKRVYVWRGETFDTLQEAQCARQLTYLSDELSIHVGTHAVHACDLGDFIVNNREAINTYCQLYAEYKRKLEGAE